MTRIVSTTILVLLAGALAPPTFGGAAPVPEPPEWSDANGSGVRVSSSSDDSEIVNNTFEDIAAHAVVLEEDSNRMELRSAGAFVGAVSPSIPPCCGR